MNHMIDNNAYNFIFVFKICLVVILILNAF